MAEERRQWHLPPAERTSIGRLNLILEAEGIHVNKKCWGMFSVGTAASWKRSVWRKPTTSVPAIRPICGHFLSPNIQFITVWRTIKLFTIQLRLILRLFTFTTPIQSDRALPTCGASLSQLRRPFRIYCASRSFLVCVCFFFFFILLQFFLTLILLTWRIWWASNNASIWQMGINWGGV